jgi:hypothetical protein
MKPSMWTPRSILTTSPSARTGNCSKQRRKLELEQAQDDGCEGFM